VLHCLMTGSAQKYMKIFNNRQLYTKNYGSYTGAGFCLSDLGGLNIT
jgi:hypothetical protein